MIEIRNSQTTSSTEKARSPRILILSSASLSPHLVGDVPAAAKWLVHTALSYLYDDLAHAQDYLRLHASWIDVVFICPPGLSNDMQRGHAVSLDRVGGFLSCADLAAGMLEVAESDDSYSWECVGSPRRVPMPNSSGTRHSRVWCGMSPLNSIGCGGGLGWFRSLVLSLMESVMSDAAYYISHGMLVHCSALYLEYLTFLQGALAIKIKNDSEQRHSILLTSI